ncbi:hypothetical protein CDO52_08590 [Nocardiopsis gilva YIM 90087]|uniref:Uncharacterized protein n=1 Tax=Nocardiopsis gilva YIM 90087 TaxID=1235441 RepID=A0A223S3Z6_9ACTN|nr:hypothetical protein [Nocardiopsis gilva]ASU82831.1 hypothetical protein CDO52_08590 [Nocardiopsis gilva YIM 90087]
MSPTTLRGISTGGDATSAGEVLQLLRRHRRSALLQRRGDVAYTAYVVAFVAVLTIPPVIMSCVEVVRAPLDVAPWPVSRAVAVSLLLASAVLALLWSSVREATVRGPIQLSAPVIDWVLPLPIDRSPLLGAALVRSVALRGAAGTAVGPLALVLLWRTVLGAPEGAAAAVALLQVACAGFLIGILSSACGAWTVVRGAGPAAKLRPWHALLQVLLLGGGGLVWFGLLPAPVAAAALWSAPWSWAVQPFAEVAGAPGAEPWSALAALAVVGIGVAALVARSLAQVPMRSLRERAAMASSLKSGVWLTDSTWFQTMVNERSGAVPRARIRLRPPRDARLLVVWRDVLGLLRAPSTLTRACGLGWCAAIAAHIDGDFPQALAIAVALAPSILLYAAASRLLPNARMEAADPRRTRYLRVPYHIGALPLQHAIVPIVCLATVMAVIAPVLLIAGCSTEVVVRTALIIPTAVAGALAGVYRGDLPDHLSLGVETPFGNTAPLQIISWHASGLIGLLVAAGPMALPNGLGAWWIDLLWWAVGTISLLLWARRRAYMTCAGQW